MRTAISVDCAGQKKPLPIPVTAATRKPCHGSWTSAYSRVPDREDRERSREQPSSAEAVDERAGDRAGDDADDRVRRDDEPGDAEPDAADVVQVDEEERERDAVPERVDEPAELKRRDGAWEGGEVGAKDAAQPWDTSHRCAAASSSTPR